MTRDATDAPAVTAVGAVATTRGVTLDTRR